MASCSRLKTTWDGTLGGKSLRPAPLYTAGLLTAAGNASLAEGAGAGGADGATGGADGTDTAACGADGATGGADGADTAAGGADGATGGADGADGATGAVEGVEIAGRGFGAGDKGCETAGAGDVGGIEVEAATVDSEAFAGPEPIMMVLTPPPKELFFAAGACEAGRGGAEGLVDAGRGAEGGTLAEGGALAVARRTS